MTQDQSNIRLYFVIKADHQSEEDVSYEMKQAFKVSCRMNHAFVILNDEIM